MCRIKCENNAICMVVHCTLPSLLCIDVPCVMCTSFTDESERKLKIVCVCVCLCKCIFIWIYNFVIVLSENIFFYHFCIMHTVHMCIISFFPLSNISYNHFIFLLIVSFSLKTRVYLRSVELWAGMWELWEGRKCKCNNDKDNNIIAFWRYC